MMTSARRRQSPVAELHRELPTGIARPRRRRKPLREHFCDGLKAGLEADPKAFAATKPRTMMGLIVRELVCAAASARCDAIKLIFDFVDKVESRRNEAAAEEAGSNPQGNIEPECAEATKWDWNEETGWDSSEREKEPREADAEQTARTEALRAELREKLIRAADARAAAERGKQSASPSSPAQFSGNFAPHSAGSVRIGGRLVDQ